MHPRSKHWHLLNYIIVRQRDRREVLDTRAMRGADCGTDHVMLRSSLRICRRKQHCRTDAKPPRKLNISALKGQKKQEELTQEMDENLKDWDSNNSENAIEEKWATLKDTVCQTASDVLGYPERKHQDWFDEHDEHLEKLLEARNTARSKMKKYSKAQSEL
ncbi:uncharacterized protein [Montipora foliosa]|uniref:uncharacterized protein n=1 Tax=Montipora foliosa TaxID=591990 RepID=UPI0035F139DC